MTKLIVDLNKLDLRELFDICHEQSGNVIKRPIRLTIPCQIHIYAAICKHKPAIACKTVEYETQSLIPLNIAGTLEEFIEHGSHTVFGRDDKTRYRHLIGKLSRDQALIICKVDIDLYIHRRARGRWDTTWR